MIVRLDGVSDDRWSNDGSDNVIVIIVDTVSLVIDDYIVQDDASMHDQIKSALRVRPANDN
jgi:hypothetical protein